jgi:queuine tRNA-ribosyltransferase
MKKPFSFTLEAIDGQARAGMIETPHGVIHTPIFMPVGTQATIKWLTREMIYETWAEIMLSNTYHLYLEPGHETVRHFGGLHKFMGVDLPILTDSGWFQVFSLGSQMEKKFQVKSEKWKVKNGEPDFSTSSKWQKSQSLVKITEEWVHFRSHRDGSKHFFTPESVMEIEEALGADIIMAFDECASGDSTHEYARKAMDRTHRWASRCVTKWSELQEKREGEWLPYQALFAIMQGVVYDDLRTESCRYISELDTPGVAIGGLSVGESKEDMYRTLDILSPILPVEKPHYLMGVGTPEDLVEGIARGIDMMDCVLPTRLARHGVAFSMYGNCKITNAKYALESGGIPVHPELATTVSRTYSLGYLKHLYTAWESLAGMLVSMHNIEYLLNIARKSREAILAGRFDEFRKRFWREMNVKI